MSLTQGDYYVPHGTAWPIIGSIGLSTMLIGTANFLNGSGIGMTMMIAGLCITLFMIFGWFRTVINESEEGAYNSQVDRSFRWGMGWFIFSEVMFFAAFFGALFYARTLSGPWLGGADEVTNSLLWDGWEYAWPTNGPGNVGGHFERMAAWGLPAINTMLLLSSGVTITLAHWALKKQDRAKLVLWMLVTAALGALFLFFQVEEYMEAYQDMNLTLGSGVYGSTFFMLTGFHGLHVTIGTIMLLIIAFRCMKGHFTPDQHFGFEAVAWYWHFVDVVWLGLFIFVYIL
ncbi:MAG: cytochrome c oxidase subunit 3 [Gammaproteobacteria bacterium]